MQSKPNTEWQTNSTVVILAAGKGTRMGGTIPKPLQVVSGKPILQRILQGIYESGIRDVVLVANPENQATLAEKFTLPQLNYQWVIQTEQRGTGHAVLQALQVLNNENTVIVLGDTPFISKDIYGRALEKLVNARVVSTIKKNPAGMGRVIRDEHGLLKKIIEEKDLPSSLKRINEINTGILAIKTKLLHTHLVTISNNNAAGEYYLTDLIDILHQHHISVETATIKESDAWQVSGVNTPQELIALEQAYSRATLRRLMTEGVKLIDMDSVHCLGDLSCGAGVMIGPGVIFEGNVSIGNHSIIGAYSVLRDTNIGESSTVKPFSVIENSTIGTACSVGPFAYCRQDTLMEDASEIGCFVESKQTTLGRGSKAKHLSYLGNLTTGAQCNIGAGVIHCNYDGKHKHISSVGDNVFIGANSSLIGPISIESHAVIAAASAITHSVASKALAIARSRQKNIPEWRTRKLKAPAER